MRNVSAPVCDFCGHEVDDPRCHCYDEYALPEAVWLPCCVCRKNPVCVSDGWDTCDECLGRQ